MKKMGLILTVMLLAGCDQQSTSTSPTTAPVVAEVTPATVHAAAILPSAQFPTRPPAIMTLDGHDIPFPAAKLAILGKSNGGLIVRLCSDDPPTSIDEGYSGNSFVFDMTLPVDNAASIPLANWDFKARSNELPDEATGIYLHGYHEQLHPADVHVTFQKDGDQILALMTGTFLHFDTQSPIAPPERVQVTTCLRTALTER
jgi:hypothetical protein